jgi:hypothetical protein
LFEGAPEAPEPLLRRGLGGGNGSGHRDSLAQKVDRFSRLATLPCTRPFARASRAAVRCAPTAERRSDPRVAAAFRSGRLDLRRRTPEQRDCEHFGDNSRKVSCIRLNVSLKCL